MESNRVSLTPGSKKMLSFLLASSLAHNQRNLAATAKNKHPSKLTVAEKEALAKMAKK